MGMVVLFVGGRGVAVTVVTTLVSLSVLLSCPVSV